MRSNRIASEAILPIPIVPIVRPRGSRPSGRVLSAQRPPRISRSLRKRLCDNARTSSTIDSAMGRTTAGASVDGYILCGAGVQIDIIVSDSTSPYGAQPVHPCQGLGGDSRLEKKSPHQIPGADRAYTPGSSPAGIRNGDLEPPSSISKPISGKTGLPSSPRKSAEKPTRNADASWDVNIWGEPFDVSCDSI